MMTKTQDQNYKNFQNSVAMTVTLLSFGMLFATMVLGYALARANSQTWPPVEIENLPMFIPLMSTFVIGLSSLAYHFFEHKGHKKSLWALTTALGFGFLALQSLLWETLKNLGILAANGNVPSMVYAFTWIHAAHIVLALFAMLWLGYQLFFKPEKATLLTIKNVGMFWHFLGVVWLVLYLMLFVL